MKNMDSTLIFLIIAILVGSLAPIQGAINAQLGQFLKHPLQATFISFLGGILTISLIVFIFHNNFPPMASIKAIPWYLFVGGFLGVIFVTTNLVLIPKLGAASLLAGLLVGQLIMSAIIDHFGLFQIPPSPITIKKIIGFILLLAGTLLVQK